MFKAVCADLCCMLWSEIGWSFRLRWLIESELYFRFAVFFVGFVVVKRVIFSCSVVAHVSVLKLELIILMYLPVCRILWDEMGYFMPQVKVPIFFNFDVRFSPQPWTDWRLLPGSQIINDSRMLCRVLLAWRWRRQVPQKCWYVRTYHTVHFIRE